MRNADLVRAYEREGNAGEGGGAGKSLPCRATFDEAARKIRISEMSRGEIE